MGGEGGDEVLVRGYESEIEDEDVDLPDHAFKDSNVFQRMVNDPSYIPPVQQYDDDLS